MNRRILFIFLSFALLATLWAIMMVYSAKSEADVWGSYHQRSILPAQISLSFIFALLFISSFFIDFDKLENEKTQRVDIKTKRQ
ncbi:MAG: hypothetical protein ABH840_04395 [Nanoarchaeota archaeon]